MKYARLYPVLPGIRVGRCLVTLVTGRVLTLYTPFKTLLMKTFKFLLLLLFCSALALAQEPVPVGKGSYASYPPLYKSKTNERHGDQSQKMLHRKLYITERMEGQPIPTNDWWTDLLMTEFSGNLWAYPLMANAEEYGLFVEFPKHWTSDGCEMKSSSQLQVAGKKFNPEAANVNGWHDWGFDFIMQDAEKQMRVSLAHGMPFAWIETQNLTLQIPYRNVKAFAGDKELTFPVTTGQLTLLCGEDAYGLYAPEGTYFELVNEQLEISFADPHAYLVVGVLPDKTDLEAFARYARTVPRETKVEWNYDEKEGKLHTRWNISAQNLAGGSPTDLLQGFIPHHYKNAYPDFSFTGYEYDTPRGRMKMATGNTFGISYDFRGIIPYWSMPEENASLKNPYSKQRMEEMIEQYANKGGFGADTYWGGKGLVQMALYMSFAHELGNMTLFEKCKHRLKGALTDWLTFTPGEPNFFFARYDKWGALVGYDTSYDSETFNDHHFHYGYFTYAASLLSIFDDEFKRDYGQMITLLAKEYANWDREDKDFPFFRTFDPWAGHSYAGGLAGWGGNGQESSSEAMQGWGGVYTLGLALNDKEIRDAGIFGWLLESRGIAEYWFDRDRENINYDLYTRPYNSNLTSQGIGWWTWFSGDPVWMHSIQWLPISPMQSHLYEDLNFARWEYTQMWEGKEIAGWETTPSIASLSNESGLGNVVLSYLQIFDADSAASVFDRMWEYEMPLAKNADTGGISYYATHSHRTYGDMQWDIYADIPSANCYLNPHTGQYTYVVHNPDENERICNFYRNGQRMKSIKVPPRKQIAYREEARISDLRLNLATLVVEPASTVQLQATAIDQYGATVEGTTISWRLEGAGSLSADGLFTAPAAKGSIVRTVVVAGSFEKAFDLRIDDKPSLTSMQVQPKLSYVEVGKEISFTVEMEDQYGCPFDEKVEWSIKKGDVIVQTDPFFSTEEIGEYTVTAKAAGKEAGFSFMQLPPFPNIALGKKAFSSSNENDGMKADNVTDGDVGSRWGSKHNDGEWVYIDLLDPSYISTVAIRWEAAFASRYEIQLGDDDTNWSTVAQCNGLGGYEQIEINQSARYVRMKALERATTYGVSIYEFEVYGIPASMNPNDVFGLHILPASVMLKEDEPVLLEAKAYNGLAVEVPANISWSCDGKAEFTKDGFFIPRQYGELSVTATTETVTLSKTYIVEESLKLQSIQLAPGNALLILGSSQYFDVSCSDQFGTPFPAHDLDHEIVGEGTTFIDNLFHADQLGDFLLIVGKGEVKDTAYISVGRIEEVNLALNKPAVASSCENNGMLPGCANDGDFNTRWGSSFNDNEYLQIDMEEEYLISKMNLFWEAAHATSYRIDVSTDEDTWTTVYEEPACKGGEEEISFEPVVARFVRIICLKRSSDYGASLWEVEIYGTFAPSGIEKRTSPGKLDVQQLNKCVYVYGADLEQVELYDLSGKLMEVAPVQQHAGCAVLNCDGRQGIYLLRATMKTNVETVKLRL